MNSSDRPSFDTLGSVSSYSELIRALRRTGRDHVRPSHRVSWRLKSPPSRSDEKSRVYPSGQSQGSRSVDRVLTGEGIGTACPRETLVPSGHTSAAKARPVGFHIMMVSQFSPNVIADDLTRPLMKPVNSLRRTPSTSRDGQRERRPHRHVI